MLKKFVLILATLCTSMLTVAEDTPVKPLESFMLDNVKIQVPPTEGWVLLSTPKTKVAFVAETEDQIKNAQVTFFSRPSEYQKDKFIAEFKSVAGKLGRVVSESYTFSDSRGYPCVKASTTSDMGKDGNSLLIQYRISACITPAYTKNAVMMIFSYISDEPIPAIDKEADAFFDNIDIPLVRTKLSKEELVGDNCGKESSQLIQYMTSKKNGLSREAALNIVKQNTGGITLSSESINNLYNYPTLNEGGHYGYYLWACVARKEGRKPLQLSEKLVREINECVKKQGDDICGKHISDRVKAGQ
ncbi:MAG: hypothetical protein B0W54_11790 [Cellvibrio sp. 79]|nr:MAG: hypothetical protein B0W54_11790 [Cellvibrio sp. 79]